MNARAIMPGLSREEELLLCCARTQMTESARATLKTLATCALDWARVAQMAKTHRLRPLLFKHLKAEGLTGAVPAEFLARLHGHAVAGVARNLALANELANVLKLFQAAGIEAIPFKGPVLAIRNYGNLGLRQFYDMDLLLRRGDMLRAKKILLERGFVSPWKQNGEWEQQHIDAQLGCDFLSADGKVRLELHWSFIQKWLTYEVDIDGIWARAVPWEFAGVKTRLVSPEDLLVYLCAHGAKHLWERLFWIVDIAEFARTETCLDWTKVVADAKRHGNWRVLALGLDLARLKFDAPIPPKVAAEIERDRAINRLRRKVAKWQFDLEKRPAPGSWEETKFYLSAKERRSDRVSYLKHLSKLAMQPSEKDRAFVKLPGALSFLYPAVRPVRWLFTRGGAK
jgi:hypothetical protein